MANYNTRTVPIDGLGPPPSESVTVLGFLLTEIPAPSHVTGIERNRSREGHVWMVKILTKASRRSVRVQGDTCAQTLHAHDLRYIHVATVHGDVRT
jgi:hypothetical protein